LLQASDEYSTVSSIKHMTTELGELGIKPYKTTAIEEMK
jgi:hypothetical protein